MFDITFLEQSTLDSSVSNNWATSNNLTFANASGADPFLNSTPPHKLALSSDFNIEFIEQNLEPTGVNSSVPFVASSSNPNEAFSDSLTGASAQNFFTDTTASAADFSTLYFQGDYSNNRFTLQSGFNYNYIFSGNGNINFGDGYRDFIDLSNISYQSIVDYNFATSTGGGISLNLSNGPRVFDALTLSNGAQIFFEGIEEIQFAEGFLDFVELGASVTPNDPEFSNQWNLHAMGVHNSWRFTQGASNIMLVSLDSGILTAPGAPGGITDINQRRLIVDPSDDDNFGDNGHGHMATSVMASTANNWSGVAGINWNSQVMVHDVYNGVGLQQAIRDTLAYARTTGMRVVFQGGIQGEGWLNHGGTQAALERLIYDNRDIALYAVAAGNGGPGGNLRDPNYFNSVSGVAKLQTNHSNVISVGALQQSYGDVHLASYSNRGSNLTLVAATDSPAMDKLGRMNYFGGTSAANPNVAGIASLVWSVNPWLSGGQVRQILQNTAIDLGNRGRDNTFGHGLINADAAVRQAMAFARASASYSLTTQGEEQTTFTQGLQSETVTPPSLDGGSNLNTVSSAYREIARGIVASLNKTFYSNSINNESMTKTEEPTIFANNSFKNGLSDQQNLMQSQIADNSTNLQDTSASITSYDIITGMDKTFNIVGLSSTSNFVGSELGTYLTSTEYVDELMLS